MEFKLKKLPLSPVKISNTFIGLVLIALIASIVMLFMLEINRDRNAKDKYEQLAQPIKEILDNNSRIGLFMNDDNPERYFEIQFVHSPTILQQGNRNLDTLLIIQYHNNEEPVNIDIDTIYTSQNENYSITLGINKHSN